MRVNVVSDVHGRTDALRQAADGAEVLICLGDLLLFLDYADHRQGIFPDLFGAEAARQLMFAAMPAPAYLTYGNVDVPRLWPGHLRPGQQVLDGQRVELDGRTFGFVGGGLRSPYKTPNELDDEEFAAKIEAVGEVDVLCTHIPPDLPELLFDTVAERMERGSEALLAAIRKTRPRYALFGHVHQPLQSRLRIGVTECVNVGHFRATSVPFTLHTS